MDEHRESLQSLTDFRRLLVSAASSNLADGVRTAALPLMAVTLTDEPLLVSGVAAVAYLPAVLWGPVGGVIIDRHDRQGLLVVGQAIRAIATVTFVGLLLADAAGIWAVYVLALLLGGAEVVVDGASQAVIPKLVPVRLLERANARMESAQLVFEQMVGTAVGGVLFAFGAVLPFAVNSVALVISGVSATSISRPLPPRPVGAAPGTWRHDIREGIAFLRAQALLRWLAAFSATANLASTVGGSVLVLLVVDELGATGAAFGLVLAAGAVAGLATSFATEPLVRGIGRGRTMLAGAGLQVIALSVIATAPSVGVVAAGMALEAASIVLTNIPTRAVRQQVVPDALQGRVVTTFRMVGFAGIPIGAVVAGVVTGLASARSAYVAATVLSFVPLAAMFGAVAHLPAAVADRP